LIISVIISFDTAFISFVDLVFSQIGLPLGGLLICLFLAYVWKTDNALSEMEQGYPNVRQTLIGKVWPVFMWVIAPFIILYNLVSTLLNVL